MNFLKKRGKDKKASTLKVSDLTESLQSTVLARPSENESNLKESKQRIGSTSSFRSEDTSTSGEFGVVDTLVLCRLCESQYPASTFKSHTIECAKKPHCCPNIWDFSILSIIAEGSYGQVYVAQKKTTGDIFAVKRISKESVKTNQKRILNERKILEKVRHPLVVDCYWTIQSKGCLYFIMEYAQGGDLYSLLEHCNHLEEYAAKFYCAELILAIDYLHSIGIIHRDIKPDNILIAKDGHIKLTDFGLSSSSELCETEIAECQSPSIIKRFKRQILSEKKLFSGVGTPDYVSPEVLASVGHSCSVDWWAVGIVLYEMLVGVPPFHGETVRETINNIKTHTFVQWESSLHPNVQSLILALLEKSPEKRLGFRGAHELMEHPFFADIQWDKILEYDTPFKPTLMSDDSTVYFKGSIPFKGSQPKCCSSTVMEEYPEKWDAFTFKNSEALKALNHKVLMQTVHKK